MMDLNQEVTNLREQIVYLDGELRQTRLSNIHLTRQHLDEQKADYYLGLTVLAVGLVFAFVIGFALGTFV